MGEIFSNFQKWFDEQSPSGLTYILQPSGLVVVCIDDQRSISNTLTFTKLESLEKFIVALQIDNSIKGCVFISTKEQLFLHGADLHEMSQFSDNNEAYLLAKRLGLVFRALESLSKPVIVAIRGTCVGGGFELALSSHYRIASDSKKTKFFMPELKIGIIPGLGGTQRLPRMVGIFRTLKMLLLLKPITSKTAKRWGLIDRLISDENFFNHSIQIATDYINSPIKKPRPFFQCLKVAMESCWIARKTIFGLTNAYIKMSRMDAELKKAPLALIATMDCGFASGLNSGLDNETKEFARLAFSPLARNLMGLVLLNERLKNECPQSPSLQLNEEMKNKISQHVYSLPVGLRKELYSIRPIGNFIRTL